MASEHDADPDGAPSDDMTPDAASEPPVQSAPIASVLDQGVAVGRTLDERVPAWLDTTVQYTWRAIVLIVGAGAVIIALTRLYLVSLPVILALILATLCVPPARRLERRGVPRLAAAFVVVIGGIGSFAGLGVLMFPTFIEQGRELQPSVAEGVDSVLIWLEEGPIGYDRTEVEQLFNQALETLGGSAGAIATQVGNIALGVVQGLAALSLAIVLLFFFVKDGEQIVAWCIKMVPDHHSDTVRAAGARGWVALSGFVRGTALVALIDALGIGIGLAILGVPAVLPLSVLIFFGGFIPVIGATVTGLLAVLVALASGGWETALIVGGLVLVVQQVESNVLQPTIMRRAVALHPVVILGVLTAGAILVGLVGAFLAVPLAAVAAAVGNELRLRHELAKRGGVAGSSPVGGPGVDPTTVRVQFPEDTQLRAAARRRERRDGEQTPRQRRARQRTREHVETGSTSATMTTVDVSSLADGVAGGGDLEHPDTALTTADLKIPIRSSKRAPDGPGSTRASMHGPTHATPHAQTAEPAEPAPEPSGDHAGDPPDDHSADRP